MRTSLLLAYTLTVAACAQTPGVPEAPRDGRVVSIDARVLTISLGATDGIEMGDELHVTRGDEYVVTICVASVGRDLATAVTTSTVGKAFPPQPDDRVRVGPVYVYNYATQLPPAAETAEGLVLSVEGRRITISIGSDDGVQLGYELHVTRGKSYVCMIRVKHVDKERAVCVTSDVRDRGFPPELNDRIYAR